MSCLPVHLNDRHVIEVAGPDATSLLQGILTQDVAGLAPGSWRHGALLTPQGKMLFDAMLWRPEPDTLWLDARLAPALAARLALYRLRAQARIAIREDLAVIALTAGSSWHGTPALARGADPRLPALGERLIVPSSTLPDRLEPLQAYHHHRVELGVPELTLDLVAEKDFALEGLMDELNGVDFRKGCYVGQEMTSRMKRRTTVRTKIIRVRHAAAAPPPGTPVLAADLEIGQTRSPGADGAGLALLRLDRALSAAAAGNTLTAAGQALTLDPPAWLELPDISAGAG